MFEIGDKVRVSLHRVLDGIDEHINGQIGTIVEKPHGLDPFVPYDYAVLIGRIKFGVNENELFPVHED